MHDAHNLMEYEGCSTALARTNNPQTSKDAAVKMVKSGELNRQEQQVYKAIVRYINVNPLSKIIKGFTTKEIATSMSEFRRYADYCKWYDICHKRFSGLKRKDKIELIQTGVKVINPEQVPSLRIAKPVYKRRDGCRCWRLK